MPWKNRLRRLLGRLRKAYPLPASRTAAAAQTFDRISERHAYTGSESRRYRIHVPAAYRGRAMPLLMVLHGCQQDHTDIQAITEFDAIADAHGFIAVYPFVTRYRDMRTRNCWGWWRPEHIAPGSGEVEDLWRIVEEVQRDFAIDADRVHITGISSGGCMAVAALTVHAGRFASGAAVAGLAYGESVRAAMTLPFTRARRYHSLAKTIALMDRARRADRTPAPLLIVQSAADESIHLRGAENLRDAWLGYFCADAAVTQRERRGITLGTAWTHSCYGEPGRRSTVETLILDRQPHGWYGGAPGRFSYVEAPRIAEEMWLFFEQHPRRAR